MTTLQVPRWAISFADLSMLLLAFFVLLQAGDTRKVAAGARSAFSDKPSAGPLLHARGVDLYEPGEARLNARARESLIRIGARAARSGKRLVVESSGRDASGARLDAWELSAARAAAVARGLALPDEQVTIVMPSRRDPDEEKGQSLTIRFES
jgi:flagellar motor protein MotB